MISHRRVKISRREEEEEPGDQRHLWPRERAERYHVRPGVMRKWGLLEGYHQFR